MDLIALLPAQKCVAIFKNDVLLYTQERLDFSCAMFAPDGGLVANAPHIPVHLGAMQQTVQYQVWWSENKETNTVLDTVFKNMYLYKTLLYQ